MSARAKRRRARAAGLPAETRPRRRLRLPTLPLIAGAAGLVLLGTAGITRLPPGDKQATDQATRFTLAIPANRQRIINNWERFFICYDLTDPAVVDLTLRANQRATGSIDFPVEQVIVELPAPNAASETAERPASGAEDELIEVRRAILEAAVPERSAAIRRQCAG